MRIFFLVALIHLTNFISAQTNVRAWYADGQVWTVWNIQLPLPETVGIYVSPNSFTDVGNATLIGRPFHLDYLPVALKEQVDTSATYRIPDGQGGTYQLGPTEGLFVYTPHQSGSLFFAVVPFGETQITPGVNSTDLPVPFAYDPGIDPVECHIQAVFPSPFASNFTCLAYYMWVDGRDNYWEARPDFPIMANAAKNGMAGFFFISIPMGLDTTQPFPLSVWLHGGGGTAQQSLAGSRADVNIRPREGILVAHNDDVFGKRGSSPAFIENPSIHFGWRKNWDPFTAGNFPTAVDTIINYTQRRYLWIDDWLIRTFNIDPTRVHIHGHSMGAMGTTALIKTHPQHYASAVIFNNGFRGAVDGENIASMLGPYDDNFPTNLINRKGEPVRILDVFDIIRNTSPQRDLPFFRSFHSKNDTGDTNYWGEDVVNNYRSADAGGHGMALYWSERAHGVDTGSDFNDHWTNGNTPDQQTIVDNVGWAEEFYRSDISYPAFFNHRLDPNANDPGDGTIGTGPNAVGDDWGTWGGWHRWDNASIEDTPDEWSIEAWLEANQVFQNDNCPHEQLTADLAIRRPVDFKPLKGDMINWVVEDVQTNIVLQNGVALVGDDDLVTIPAIVLYPESERKVKITLHAEPVGIVNSNPDQNKSIVLFPNPTSGDLSAMINMDLSDKCSVSILSLEGVFLDQFDFNLEVGQHQLRLPLNRELSAGIYVVELKTSDRNERMLLMKI